MEKGVGGLTESSKEQHFTVVLLDNTHRNAYVSCSPILQLPPLYHTACLLLLTKSLTSCTSRNINLSKTIQRTAMRVPPGHRSLRILPHTTPPARRKQLRGQCFAPIPNPQPLPPSLLKKKWGNYRVIMLPFCESAAKMAAPHSRKFPSSKTAPLYWRLPHAC
jgi:hypothetical protein